MALSDPKDIKSLSYRLRSKRDHFLREFLLRNGRSIIDLGGTSDYWRRVGLDFLKDNGFTVTIVNIRETELGEGPFRCMVGNACAIDAADNSFDIVHSNSVIEHVGGWTQVSDFAREVRRLAPAYYVQTPNWWFPIDPHFWKVPCFHWMPEAVRAELLHRFPVATVGRIASREIARRVLEGTRLLSKRQMRALFPDAQLRPEKFAGLNKSWIATRG